MSAVGEVLDRKEQPSFVRFERRAIEDFAKSREAGHYVAVDIDYALITPPYSKDVFVQPVTEMFEQRKQDVVNGRFPEEWLERYKKQYAAWKNGQEMPLEGTAIKGWGVISPAMQETLIRINVLTVESLAAINDEGIKRIGMGAVDLKHKARVWLSQLSDKGPLVQEMAADKAKIRELEGQLQTLSRQVSELSAALDRDGAVMLKPNPVEVIGARDILEDHDAIQPTHEQLVSSYTARFGKPPHHRMKDATIAEALK